VSDDQRSIGFWGATGIGVGAIVGGGILALAGVAFSATGPSALLAFALNGLIAFLTALSFAEMSSAFPESGGTYSFAKKVLKGEAAFLVGWVVWMASIVAAVLYALGFAAYVVTAIDAVLQTSLGGSLEWVGHRAVLVALATGAILFYGVGLARSSSGGRQWATVGKVLVFVVLIAAGLWALTQRSPVMVTANLRPFFPGGSLGLFQAMGFTFIALQGFDLIAAVGGEVRDARTTIPKAMMLSLAMALAIYLPLLFVIATVGVDEGGSIVDMSRKSPATVVAQAARNFLGPFGFWLVIVAAVLSMLSALHANLLAASRVALTMARDRSLPESIGSVHSTRGTPMTAIVATIGVVLAILLLVPDVATAGAAASLVFLLSFAIAHGTNILAQTRGGVSTTSFRVPWFPLVPVLGGSACLALAAFQGLAVPEAGWVVIVWLGLGFALYFFLFARRARVVDASQEGLKPDLVRLRGRSPLVLVPIAKPGSAAGLVEVANALAPPMSGRVLLLSVVQPPGTWHRGDLAQQLLDVEAILNQSLSLSLSAGTNPEWLTTVASDPWSEIRRVARLHRCESLLLGLGDLTADSVESHLEDLISNVDSDVVILRSPEGWKLSETRRVLVPVGGHRDQSRLRARLLGSLCRDRDREIVYLRVLPAGASETAKQRARREAGALASDEVSRGAEVRVLESDDAVGVLSEQSSNCDLLVLGIQRQRSRRRVFGPMTRKLVKATSCPLILISAR
jgi:amino acid transporter/nucleotide-binding universal stress UspA family protein